MGVNKVVVNVNEDAAANNNSTSPVNQQQQQQYAAALTQLMLGSLGAAATGNGTNPNPQTYDLGVAFKVYQMQLQQLVAANYLQSIRQNGNRSIYKSVD